MALVQRLLSFQFNLSSGGSLSVSGLRANARISKPGGLELNTADCTIYGMSLSDMKQLNLYGLNLTLGKAFDNTVTITAGSSGNNGTCFVGNIVEAYIDLNNMPNVALKFTANSGYTDNLAQGAKPTSYQGYVKASQLMTTIAGNMATITNGVQNTLQNDPSIYNPNYSGSYLSQIRDVARDANIDATIDDGTLILSTPTTFRSSGVTISADTGMIGSPIFDANGIIVKTIYNPQINFKDQITVQSILIPQPGNYNTPAEQEALPGASGSWNIYSIYHDLDTITPNGKWETTIKGNNPNQQTPLASG